MPEQKRISGTCRELLRRSSGGGNKSAIDGRLQLLEQRLSSLLFKQTVELDMGLSLLAECVNLDESVLRKQRAKSVNDVKRTNGQLRLEQKLRTQEPFDEWPD